MADIFISYARQDGARVAPLVAALEAQGWSVWWDPEITPGQEFDRQISAALDAAKAVIVVWTPLSVDSRWVRGEAREAADRGVLVPVRFENTRLPIDARAMHTTDLDDWKEDRQSRPFQDLLRALRSLIPAIAGTVVTPGASGTAARHAAAPEDLGRSICVLPFVNMSGDPEQEYFSDGLSEELLNQLAQMKGLKVAARTSCFAFKGQTPDLKIVGEKLGVAHVLEGSVRKAGNRLRITAQLIKAADGYHLWSNTFNRELDDVFQIQEDIARAVADALKITLGMGKTTLLPGGTQNTEAYDKYLRARALFTQGGSAELTRAAQIYREVLALDPDFALAWYGLYAALAINLNWVPEEFAAARKEMDQAGARIEALAPDAWWTLAMRAEQLRLQHKWAEAEVASQKALAAAPSEVDPIRNHSSVLSDLGRIKEAVEFSQRAVRLDALSLGLSARLQYRLDFAGRPEEAQAEYERSKDLAGDRLFWEWFAMLRLWRNKDAGPAAVKAQFQIFLKHEKSVRMALHHTLVDLLDNQAAASAAIRQAFEDPANQDALGMFFIAYYADHYGDKDLALAALRRGTIDLNINVVSVFLWWPCETGLRADPRFKQIVRDLGLYDYWRASGKWGDFARPLGDDDFEVFR